jgi:uncharacterized protein YbaP (TraB family)
MRRCLLLLAVMSVMTQPAAPAALEEVVVSGERAGPQLWKLSKGDHVLWIVGTLDVMPKRITWHSAELERIMQDSQEVLPYRYSFEADMGLMQAVRWYRQFRKMEKIGVGTTLQSVLPEALFARYRRLRQRYAPREPSLDTLRPTFASGRLSKKILNAAGLSAGDRVDREVLRLAQKHKVPVRHLEAMKVTDPTELLDEFTALSIEQEIPCFAANIERLESGLGSLQRRAVAWANGDVKALRELPNPDTAAACAQLYSSSALLGELTAREHAARIDALIAAIARNRTTLALYPIDDLLAHSGVLSQLKAQGYDVDGP